MNWLISCACAFWEAKVSLKETDHKDFLFLFPDSPTVTGFCNPLMTIVIWSLNRVFISINLATGSLVIVPPFQSFRAIQEKLSSSSPSRNFAQPAYAQVFATLACKTPKVNRCCLAAYIQISAGYPAEAFVTASNNWKKLQVSFLTPRGTTEQ